MCCFSGLQIERKDSSQRNTALLPLNMLHSFETPGNPQAKSQTVWNRNICVCVSHHWSEREQNLRTCTTFSFIHVEFEQRAHTSPASEHTPASWSSSPGPSSGSPGLFSRHAGRRPGPRRATKKGKKINTETRSRLYSCWSILEDMKVE